MGQALTELAIVLPVLLLLVLAGLDLGRIYFARITVANAAREAAMYAADNPTDTGGAQDAAVNESNGSFVTVAKADVAISCSPSCSESYGTTVTAHVTGRFSLATPLMGVFFGGQDVTFASSANADVVSIPDFGGGVGTPPSSSPSSSPSASASSSASASASASASPSPTPCPAPIAGFTFSQQNKNKPVVFVSTSSPTSGPCAINFWRWEFGDSSTEAGNLATVNHDFPAQGTTYQVTLTVTVTGGITSSVTGSVTTR